MPESRIFSSMDEIQHGGEVPLNPRCCLDTRRDRDSPTGRAESSQHNLDEQLFRSVEGQAASDEEDERWTGEQQKQVDEVKKILTRLSCCGDRCDERVRKNFLSHWGESWVEESHTAVLQLLDRVTHLHKQLELRDRGAHRAESEPEQMKDWLEQELQQKAEEMKLLQRELQMLETERVRLSLVEEKLMDVLQLLQQLRNLNVSRRSLGKILLSSLESCNDPQHGKVHIMEVLNVLCHELAECEILSSAGTPERASSHQSLTNLLLISC